MSEELFCRELTVSLVCISLWRRDGAGTAEDQAASAALLPWEAGFSPAPSGRSAALSTADAALVPLPRQGSCRMTSNHLLKLDFSIYHWLFVTRTRSASRCPEQLQREDGSRCSAALATVLDLYGLSWFCSFTVASRLRNHSSSKQQRRQQQAHVRATGCV